MIALLFKLQHLLVLMTIQAAQLSHCNVLLISRKPTCKSVNARIAVLRLFKSEMYFKRPYYCFIKMGFVLHNQESLHCLHTTARKIMLTFKVTFTLQRCLNLFLLAKCSFYMKYIWGEGLKVLG